MKIYVSNLDFSVASADLKTLFEEFGEVNSALIITDRISEASRGFGFVEMLNDEQAEAAIKGINGKMFKNRTLIANKARDLTASRRN